MKEIPESFIKYEIHLEESLCLEKTFDCGQCFRWEKSQSDGCFEGVVSGRLLIVKLSRGVLTVYSSEPLEEGFIKAYFGLLTSYDKINLELKKRGGIPLTEALKRTKGLRILKQDFFETLISFIISQNNNIPRIKTCIENLCREYGKLIFEHDGKKYYSFPEPENLAGLDPDEVQVKCRVGYRAPFIVKAAAQYLNGEIDLSDTRTLDPDKCVKKLCGYYGVGNKVANCIMLFAGLRQDAFPVDVWVERMLVELYGLSDLSRVQMEKWGRTKFGEYAGIAQQYLFYYIRIRKEE